MKVNRIEVVGNSKKHHKIYLDVSETMRRTLLLLIYLKVIDIPQWRDLWKERLDFFVKYAFHNIEEEASDNEG